MNFKFSNIICILLLGTILCSCEKETIKPPNPDGEKIILYAAIDGGQTPQQNTHGTKVGYDEQGTGVRLKWTSGDALTVFNTATGMRLGDFVLTSIDKDGTGIFESKDLSDDLTDGVAYTVIFPATNAPTLQARTSFHQYFTQVGNNSIQQCEKVCYMEHKFIHNSSKPTVILMKQEMVMLTVRVKCPTEYSKKENGDPIYAVVVVDGKKHHITLNNFNSFNWQNDSLKMYIVTPPHASTNKAISVRVFTDKGDKYFDASYTSKKAWVKSKRYTVSVAPISYAITKIANAKTELTIKDPLWVIYEDINATNVTPLLEAFDIASLETSNADITLVLLNTIDISDNPFVTAYSYENLGVLIGPKLKTIGRGSFGSLGATYSYVFPVIEKIPTSTFASNGSVKTLCLPNVTHLEDRAIYNCRKLETLELGTVGKTSITWETTDAVGRIPNVDLFLGQQEKEKVNGYKWGGLGWKSITIVR